MILAGGGSRRFGTDKAFALWNGRPFIRCVADAMLPVCEEVHILGRPEVGFQHYRDAVPEARVKVDLRPGAGPHIALRDILESLRSDWVLVAPCDAPALTAEDCQRLVQDARKHKTVVVGASSEGLLFDLFCAPRPLIEDRLKTASRLQDVVHDARAVPMTAAVGLNINEQRGSPPEKG